MTSRRDQLGVLPNLDPPALVVREVDLKAVEFVRCHDIEVPLEIGYWNEVPRRIDQQPAPAKARIVRDAHARHDPLDAARFSRTEDRRRQQLPRSGRRRTVLRGRRPGSQPPGPPPRARTLPRRVAPAATARLASARHFRKPADRPPAPSRYPSAGARASASSAASTAAVSVAMTRVEDVMTKEPSRNSHSTGKGMMLVVLLAPNTATNIHRHMRAAAVMTRVLVCV